MSQSKYQLGFTSLDRETSVNELTVRNYLATASGPESYRDLHR